MSSVKGKLFVCWSCVKVSYFNVAIKFWFNISLIIILLQSMADDSYPDLVAREQKLQGDVLKLSEENLSLRFEVTQLQQEVPRLKVSARNIRYSTAYLLIDAESVVWFTR